MLNLKLSILDSEKCKSFWKFCNVDNYANIADKHNVNLSIIYDKYDSFAYYMYRDREIILNPPNFNKVRKSDKLLDMKGCKTRILWALTFYHELGHNLSSKIESYRKIIENPFILNENRYKIEKIAWKLGLKEGIKDKAFTKKDIKESINFIKSCLDSYKRINNGY